MKIYDVRVWRVVAIVLGTSLMVGEAIRSWGQGRNFLFVVDDFLIGIPLVVSGLLMSEPTVARHCALSASFAACCGGLYHSFFGKLVGPAIPVASNIASGLLTTLIGVAFAVSLSGLAASIRAAAHYPDSTRGAAQL